MGAVLSDQRKLHKSLFVDEELAECCPLLANSTQLTEDFVRYIKDGSWIDLLAESNYFTMQISTLKAQIHSVTFYHTSNNALSHLPIQVRSIKQSSSSMRSSSASTKDSYQGSVENFTDFYANIEEKTCFTQEQMASFLISIVYPLYGQLEIRQALCERESLIDYDENDPDFFSTPDHTQDDVIQLQEMLLSTAAFFDEHDLHNTIESQDWIKILEEAVNECPLDVCICSVESHTNSLSPVLINNIARKRLYSISTKTRSRKQQKGLNFLELWSIESEDELENSITQNIRNAQPLRLQSHQIIAQCRTILDITHIFDSNGMHRYVLGVKMNVPEDGQSEKHLQYLQDTVLLISHIIKPGKPTSARNSGSAAGGAASSTVPFR